MKTQPLPFHVFDALHRLRCRCATLDDAKAICALLGVDSSVARYRRNGPTEWVWRQPSPFPACDTCGGPTNGKGRCISGWTACGGKLRGSP